MSQLTPRMRLDLLLVERGFFDSREKAQRSIMAGDVRVGEEVASKPGTRIASNAALSVAAAEKYVSRGGVKLEAALDHFVIDPCGWTCLDIGASTGGFTDCLLQRGAEKVHAVDVGHGQLDWKIRSDSRVIVREKLNARFLSREDVPDPIKLCVIDVSFISLTLILPRALELLTSDGVIVALIKPQFELQRAQIGRGGIVRDSALHDEAVEKIRDFTCVKMKGRWLGVIDSPILGTKGNKEFLACLSH